MYRMSKVIAVSLTVAISASSFSKPNIIVIVSDDAGFNEFSINGSKEFNTPNIDSIGKNGVWFKSGYTSGPVCSPTRAGLLTGRYQQRFGHEFNFAPAMSETKGLPTNLKTGPDFLKAAGYKTVAIGKWHLGYAEKFHPLQRGFTDFYGFLAGSRTYFPIQPPKQSLVAMMLNKELIKEEFTYLTDELARKATETIEGPQTKPYFIYLAFNGIHSPSDALTADIEAVGPGSRAKKRAQMLALDRAVGTVIASVKRSGQESNTLICFVNDNGGATGHDNTPLQGHKGSLWEGGIRVPMLMSWAGQIKPGSLVDAPVMSFDLMATAMEVAGAKPTRGFEMDGKSLLAIAMGKTKRTPHDALFWRFGKKFAVRKGDWKYCDPEGTGSPKLFNLKEDVGEKIDRAAEQPKLVQELKKRYEDWDKKNVSALWQQASG
jgi:arylsulfatase A-like enzyme